ncbi:hypothetical protein BDP27DRAFT_1403035 [Rhodocollybia butyracea]|uniref:C2H2-type domain-containing protein n=1 Tax=Rhodocollybia butyracea TaxID=206335 RepID=A0A9P5PUA6_9AGAR|nr:hypothetical protein BDP27DRAFT_1403035 [Rhodocollybia butyracea]
MFEYSYSTNNASHSSGELPPGEFQATSFLHHPFHPYPTNELHAGNRLSPVLEHSLASIPMDDRYFHSAAQEYNYYGPENERSTVTSDEEVLRGYHNGTDANSFLRHNEQMPSYAPMNDPQNYHNGQYSPLSASVQEYGSQLHTDEIANGSLEFEAHSSSSTSQRPSRPTVSVDLQLYSSLDSSSSTPYSAYPPTPASGNGSPHQEIRIYQQQPLLDPRSTYPGLPVTYGSISPVQEGSEGKLTVATSKVREAAVRKRKFSGPGKYKCSRCGDDFTTKHNLQHHENAHKGLKPYMCAYCSQAFTVPRSKDRHEQNIHSVNKPPS